MDHWSSLPCSWQTASGLYPGADFVALFKAMSRYEKWHSVSGFGRMARRSLFELWNPAVDCTCTEQHDTLSCHSSSEWSGYTLSYSFVPSVQRSDTIWNDASIFLLDSISSNVGFPLGRLPTSHRLSSVPGLPHCGFRIQPFAGIELLCSCSSSLIAIIRSLEPLQC
jgi:hypothetical protein